MIARDHSNGTRRHDLWSNTYSNTRSVHMQMFHTHFYHPFDEGIPLVSRPDSHTHTLITGQLSSMTNSGSPTPAPPFCLSQSAHLHSLPYFIHKLNEHLSTCSYVSLCVRGREGEREDWWFPSVPSKTTTQRPHYVVYWIEGWKRFWVEEEKEGKWEVGREERMKKADVWKQSKWAERMQ